MSTPFRLLKQFDEERGAKALKHRPRVRPKHVALFPGDSLADKFARALCEESACPLKEILEAFEFFQVVRKYVATKNMADVCAGHGLVGVLFALFEHVVESVQLIDKRQPESFERTLNAVDKVGPWARPEARVSGDAPGCSAGSPSFWYQLGSRARLRLVNRPGDRPCDRAARVVSGAPCCHRTT